MTTGSSKNSGKPTALAPDVSPGPASPQATWWKVGELKIRSGVLEAGDPCVFDSDESALIRLPKGTYAVEIRELEFFGGTWTSRLRVASDVEGTLAGEIASVCIDSGEFGVGDRKDYGPSVVEDSGFGDGCYAIYEILKGSGRVGIEVVFLE